MCPPVRSKKMAGLAREGQTVATGHLTSKMVRIGPMARAIFPLNRRELMAGLGAAALGPALPSGAMAQARVRGWPSRPKPTCSPCARAPRIRRSGRLPGPTCGSGAAKPVEVSFANDLPVPARSDLARHWQRLGRTSDGPTADPGGARESVQIPLRYAGTFLCDLRLLGDGQARPSRAPPIDRSGKGARRGRSRRGAADRGLAAAAGRNRHCARHGRPGTQPRSTRSTAASRRISPAASTSG